MIERDASPELLMSPKEQELRDKLVRNFDSAELTRDERAPLYAGAAARLARGTAATQLGITRESPEVVEYPDSGKYLAMAQGTQGGVPHAFGRMHREKDNLDYWDGEP